MNNNSNWGAIIGIIIIVLLVVAGGVYFFLTEQERLQEEQADRETQALEETSPSDSVNDIETDLNATGEVNLDSETSGLEQSL